MRAATATVTLLVFAACASSQTEAKRSTDTLTVRINSFSVAALNAQGEIQGTLAAHSDILNNKDGDLKTPFRRFQLGLDALEKRRVEIRERLASFQAAAPPFFANWDKEIAKLESESARAEERQLMQKTPARFEKIDNLGKEARAAYERLLPVLLDHRGRLTDDLSLGVAEGLREDRPRMEQDASQVYSAIDRLEDAVERYNQSLAMRRAL